MSDYNIKIFTRRFILNLAQYREFRAAFQITDSTPAMDMAGKPAPASVLKITTTPEHKSSSKATQIVTDSPQFVKDRSDIDSESILHQRVMTWPRNVSFPQRDSDSTIRGEDYHQILSTSGRPSSHTHGTNAASTIQSGHQAR